MHIFTRFLILSLALLVSCSSKRKLVQDDKSHSSSFDKVISHEESSDLSQPLSKSKDENEISDEKLLSELSSSGLIESSVTTRVEVLTPGLPPEEMYKVTDEVIEDCFNTLSKLPGKTNSKELRRACSQVLQFPTCESEKGRPIYHYNKPAKKDDGLKILVLSLIHGDEFASGSVSRAWMERLNDLEPRSHWRILPVTNPDGLKLRHRPNANGVDINRNFPTKNWDELAHKVWKHRYKATWRKFPGKSAASEKETQCIIAHIQDFTPDFIISIHTPLGHLDFDGPKMNYPNFNLLPWRKFGHYPGSLGRYMWRDNKTPVLTVELKGASPIKSLKELDNLQDISGSLAIKAKKEVKSKKLRSQKESN